jgi:multidrug resistance protein
MARTYRLIVAQRLPLYVPPRVLHGLLLLLMISGPLTSEIIMPALPAIGSAFGLPLTRVQLLVSVFMFGYALSQLLIGPLSDRIGRRPVLVIGLILYVVAGAVGALATALPLLLCARLLQGMSVSVAPVLARVIVRDLYDTPRATRLLAYLGAIMAIGPGLAPIFGSIVNQFWGWRAILIFLVGFGVMLFGLVFLLAPETRPQLAVEPTRPENVGQAYLFLVGQTAYLRSLLARADATSGASLRNLKQYIGCWRHSRQQPMYCTSRAAQPRHMPLQRATLHQPCLARRSRAYCRRKGRRCISPRCTCRRTTTNEIVWVGFAAQPQTQPKQVISA